jgi:hypothetical protein
LRLLNVEYLYLIAALVSVPSAQPQLVALCHCDEPLLHLQVSHDAIHGHFLQQSHALRFSLDAPHLHHVVDPSSREEVCLLEVVERADPPLLVGMRELEDGLILLGVPKIDGAVLAGGDEAL